MNRRRFLALAALAGLVPLRARAGELSLDEISAYLNRYTTGEGGFTQINADGTISTGRIWIKRPGRIRFEYAPPDEAMFIAGGGQVAVFDPRSNEGPERYPLNQTPLNIILERNVDLARRGMVTGHESDGTTTTVTAQDPDHPEYGAIRLVFTADPIELRQWIVRDEGGTETTVILNDVQTGGRISDRLFNIQAEIAGSAP
ncbi:MAG: outer membrane lipoprotein carrier protein LolA [Rubellimicrobium sp.]|nr:outer membrane lipoprotein carrier protein LolA [Rubellimicrobium sp.]